MQSRTLLALITAAAVATSSAAAACFSEKLGYPCCKGVNVVYTDEDGDWGVENNDWCGIASGGSSSATCWSLAQNYPCCTAQNPEVYYVDDDGKEWGVENDDWCGIVKGSSSSAVKTTTTVKVTKTSAATSAASPTIDDSNVPAKPALSDYKAIKDPAGSCDISDSIKGDSLAKVAPFRFGVGIYGTEKSAANIMSVKMRELIKYQFNSVTYTNMMKSLFMLDEAKSRANAQKGNDMPVLKFDGIVDGLEYCKENGIKMRGHTLVWHTQAPGWYFREGFNANGAYVSSDKMEKRLESYMQQMFGFLNKYYPGVIDVWDVVNEAVEDNNGSYETGSGFNIRIKFDQGENPWYKTMGTQYVHKAFRLARKYAPAGTKLIYNDYNTFTSVKNAAIIRLVTSLKKEGLIDGVGMQSYLGPTWPNLNDYKNAIMNFSKTGLDIQITELTFSVDTSKSGSARFEAQAQHYKKVFQIIMDCKKSGANITSVTVFGLQDHYLFYSNDNTETRLWDRDLKKKPAYYSVMEALKGK